MTDLALAFAELIARGARQPTLIHRIARALTVDAQDGGCAITLEAVGVSADKLRDEVAIGTPEQSEAPIILTPSGRLYLQRFFRAERILGEALRPRLQAIKDSAFSSAQLNPAQRQAVALALASPLTLIFGGPGTGKTHTAGALLKALATRTQQPLYIALAAPTGKAAARLREMVGTLQQPLLQVEALTLHQLLNLTPNDEPLNPDASPLGHDLIVLDECSMVPLGLLAALLSRVRPSTRLVLMGDPDQLDAVNEGFAFAELRRLSLDPRRALQAVAVTLTEQQRYASDSALHRFAEAVRNGDTDAALAATAAAPETLTLASFDEAHAQRLLTNCLAHFSALAALSPLDALRAQKRFQILSARRTGPFSVEAINQAARAALGESAHHWFNQPIMIEANARALGLYNGDIGLMRIDESDGELKFFTLSGNDNLTIVPLSQLPNHRPAYAITIHKSQGSEFDTVAAVLTDTASPILNRQLVYTAVTRARRRAVIYASSEALQSAIQTAAPRVSGLADYFPPSPLLRTEDQLALPF
jgi:exodeoxyribonuclease V alpha subunit